VGFNIFASDVYWIIKNLFRFAETLHIMLGKIDHLYVPYLDAKNDTKMLMELSTTPKMDTKGTLESK